MADRDVQTLLDTKTKDSIVFQAVLNITRREVVGEPAELWSSIANSMNYSADRRRWAAFELFRRHIKEGMSLRDAAAVLSKSSWLRCENVRLVTFYIGHIPVRLADRESVIAIRLKLPADDRSDVYVRVNREVPAVDVCNALRGEQSGVADALITQVGIAPSDDHDLPLIYNGPQ